MLGLGYAEGYPRAMSPGGFAVAGGVAMPVIGRVSMDLLCVDAGTATVDEGDWVEVDFDLPRAAALTGLAQYELLTRLGGRYTRRWS